MSKKSHQDPITYHAYGKVLGIYESSKKDISKGIFTAEDGTLYLEKLLLLGNHRSTDKFLLAQAVELAVNFLRPDILKEYHLDILEKMEFELDFGQEIYLGNLDKLTVIFSRIFDEIFLKNQLNVPV